MAKSETWSIDKLKLWDKNPRSIKTDRFEELKTRLKRQGQIKPLLVTQDGTVIGGNMRLRAMQALGIKEVWVSVTNATTDKEIFDLALTDNEEFGYYEKEQVAELALELGLSQLELKSYALSLGEPTTLDLVLDELGPEITEEDDEAPEVDESHPPVSVLGEVYQLGEHRLMCGSATELDDVEKLMDGKKADMVFTDPPYNTGMTEQSQGSATLWRGTGKQKGGSTRLSHMFNDSFTDDEWQDFMSSFCSSYFMLMKDNAAAYICLDWRRNHELIPHIKDHFSLSNIIVWDKVVHGLGSDYKYTYELINVCKKGSPALTTHQGDREYSDVWHIQRKMGRDEDHATKKPIELCTRSMRHASKPNDLIVDLFGGSGSTLIAADKTNRICYMMELDPKYCDVIRKRYHKHVTGDEEGWQEATPAVEVSHAVTA